MNNLKPKKLETDAYMIILKNAGKIYQKNFFQILSFGTWLFLISAFCRRFPVHGGKFYFCISSVMMIGFIVSCKKFYFNEKDSFSDFFSFIHNEEVQSKTSFLLLIYIVLSLLIEHLLVIPGIVQFINFFLTLGFFVAVPLALYEDVELSDLSSLVQDVFISNWPFFFVLSFFTLLITIILLILTGGLFLPLIPGFLGVLIFGLHLKVFQDKPSIE